MTVWNVCLIAGQSADVFLNQEEEFMKPVTDAGTALCHFQTLILPDLQTRKKSKIVCKIN